MTLRIAGHLLVVAGAALGLLTGCRGQPSDVPPIHLVADMDHQPKFRPESASSMFADGRAMRPLVEGTVAQGHLGEDDVRERGKEGDKFVSIAPVTVDARLLARGEERFNIFCSVCHDKTGSGHGMVVKRGYPIPIDLASERVRGLADGEIFHVIGDGVRNMPSYRAQIPVDDRWAIVAWVRVLQRSQRATVADVPAAMIQRIEPEVTQ